MHSDRKEYCFNTFKLSIFWIYGVLKYKCEQGEEIVFAVQGRLGLDREEAWTQL